MRRIRREPPVGARVPVLLADDPTVPGGRSRGSCGEAGTPLGLSTVYLVLAGVRATLPATLLVRFGGVAGEFAQFDFGEVSVRLLEGPPARGPLRRLPLEVLPLEIHVVLVPNVPVEAWCGRSWRASRRAGGPSAWRSIIP